MSTEFDTYRKLTEEIGHSRDAERASMKANDESRGHYMGYIGTNDHSAAIGRHEIARNLHTYAAGQASNKHATAHHDAMAAYHETMLAHHDAHHKK